MAALDFPASPTVGQSYTANTQSWTWNGTSWIARSAVSAVPSASPPSDPLAGDLWWNSEDGKLKVYYNDGNTSQWVDAFVGTVGPAGAAGATGPTGASGTIDGTTVTTFTGILKGNGSNISAATAGTDYQAVLVSGTSIKTVKSTSLLGSGDIPINEPPTGGTTGQVLTKNSATDYDFSWTSPSAGALTHAEGLLGADVQMPSSNTWYDGPTVSLAAGTWLVNCHMTQIRNATTAENIYARISDGTTHHASQQAYHPSASGSGCNVTMTTVLTVASTTTIKGQMATSAGSTSSLIKAAMAANGAGNNASIITAIKIG